MSAMYQSFVDVIYDNSHYALIAFPSIIILIILILTAFWATKGASKSYTEHTRAKQRSEKSAARRSSVQEKVMDYGRSSAFLNSLADTDLGEIRKRSVSRTVSPMELLRSFQSRALDTHALMLGSECEFIREADDIANAHKSYSKELRGRLPLASVPVSLNETLAFRSYETAKSLAQMSVHATIEEPVITQTLLKLGAIPFITVCSEREGVSSELSHPVFGDVCHPANPQRMVGGCSGMEAVLVATRASPLGVGPDTAGHLRIPAAFCGISCLKPSSQRISTRRIHDPLKEKYSYMKTSVGLLTRKVDELATVFRAILSPAMFELDSRIPPLPFNEDLYSGKSKPRLTIGYFSTFKQPDLMLTVPAVQRAIALAVNLLERRGHTLVQVELPDPIEANRLGCKALLPEGGETVLHLLCKEKKSNSWSWGYFIKHLPRKIGQMVCHIFSKIMGKTAAQTMYPLSGVIEASDTFRLTTEIAEYQNSFEEMWANAGNLDALLAPATAFPAPPLSVSKYYVVPTTIYAIIYNLIDWPAGTVPVSEVNNEDIVDSRDAAITMRIEGDKFNKKVLDFQEGSEELPLSVQVVAKPWAEETVLRIMLELEKDSGYWPTPKIGKECCVTTEGETR